MLRSILKIDNGLPVWPLVITIVLHVITPFFSTGFFHFDEHFQILEFLSYYRGNLDADLLPWEFSYRMRSWVQPLFYYLIQKPQLLIGIQDPFIHVLSFRMVTSLLSLVSLGFLWRWKEREFTLEEKKTFLYLSCLLWFLPFLHARHSSETFSSLLFVIALSLLFIKQTAHWAAFLAGLLFSLCIFARFQLGIPIAFALLWFLLIQKETLTKLLVLVVSILMGCSLCVLVDSLGYGELTFTPWNYLEQNLILGKVSNFGHSPWYDYLKQLIQKPFLPIGLFLVLSLASYWYHKKSDILTWVTLSFFIVHQLISHKELRFLFPMATLLPVFMTTYYHRHLNFFRKWKKTTYAVLGVNCLLLIVYAFKPIHPSYNFYQFLYRKKISTLYVHGQMNPFRLADLPTHYFKRPNLVIKGDKNIDQLPHWIFFEKAHQAHQVANDPKCQLHYSTYPLFILKNNSFYSLLKKHKVWALYQCSQ